MERVLPHELPDNAVLVDVRDELEAEANPLTALSSNTVLRVPLVELEDGATLSLPTDRPVIVVCGNGSRGELAGAFLELAGAQQVQVLEGGVRAWKQTLQNGQ